ncbi:alpha/beta hydrolase [Aurantibacillus circumpalustris]|uniref:alpha/beta hydrolase n=1 Tax=Aurantibacillus circumpalustris TaxID=3036359 RepID=UPI00295BD715|nr:alpha/beta hydrolase [Aurantibacillus circumpalustris]
MEIVYTIPGLGTDRNLFKNISIPQHSLKILEWPKPEPAFTLSDYAKTFIDQIDKSTPINMMGVSFGGMLCCEIADLIQVKKLVLISSCKTREELPIRIKFLKIFPLHKLVRDSGYRKLVSKLSWFIGFEKNDLFEFKQMAQSMPPNYFKYCIDMIINWPRKYNSQTIYHIHGLADRLLPSSKIKNFEPIKNGNHAMVVYKAHELNSILKKVFNGH